MNNQPVPAPISNTEIAEENPLEFWVAYQVGTDGKFYYLGNGKGDARVYKTEQAINDFFDNLNPPMTAEDRARTVIHPIDGKILVPIDGYVPVDDIQKQRELRSLVKDIESTMKGKPLGRPNLSVPNLNPIHTLAPLDIPGAADLLLERAKNKKHRRRK